MSRLYQEGHRELQRQFDTERLADRLEQVTYHTLHHAGGSRVHRAPRHVLPRDRGRGGPAELLVQGRRSGLRARARREHARVPELRRQRHVPVVRQRADEPARRHAVHRLRGGQAHSRERHGVDRAGQRVEPAYRAGAVHRQSAACAKCFRTARATSTSISSWSARSSCRAPTFPRRCRRGNVTSGRKTCCRRAIRRRTE